jgi:Integral membrane protein S linking to the trans Golgi network
VLSLPGSGFHVSSQSFFIWNFDNKRSYVHGQVSKIVVLEQLSRHYGRDSIFDGRVREESGVWVIRCRICDTHFLSEPYIRAVLLAIIVEKSKKCLDFSVTLFLLHFFFCLLYGGLPRTWDWYIIHILGTITMVLMGEYLCSKRELDEIPLLAI